MSDSHEDLDNVIDLGDDALSPGERAAQRDAQQTLQRIRDARASGNLSALQEAVLSAAQAAVEPAAAPVGKNQRLRIHVPNVKTTLTMGQKAPGGNIRSEDTGAPNYDGFGVHTLGHVFVDAASATSKMTLQAQSDVTIQSQAGLSIGGKGGLLAGAQAGATVYGGGGVTIYGGQPALWGADPPGSDGQGVPEAPTWVNALGSAATALGAFWAGADAMWAVRNVWWKRVKSKLGSEFWADSGGVGRALTIAGHAGTVASSMGAIAWAPGIKTWAGHWSWPFGGTTIHGTAGLIMGSGLTMGIYSVAGTSIATPAVLDLSAGSIAIGSKKNLAMRAAEGSMSLGGGGDVELLAANKLELGSRNQQALLYGSSVKIGKHAAEKTQKGTDAVTIDADRLVEINAGRLAVNVPYTEVNGTSGVTLGGAHVLLSAGTLQGFAFDKAVVHSLNKLEVGVGKWLMKADKSSLTLGCANEPLPELPKYEGKDPVLRNADGSHKYWKDALSQISDKMKATEKYNKQAESYNAKFADTCHIEMKSSKMILNVGGYQFVGTSSEWKAGSALVVKK